MISCSLSALGPNTYEAFQASNDLKNVVQRAMQTEKLDRQLSIKAYLMTPVKPMLVCFLSVCLSVCQCCIGMCVCVHVCGCVVCVCLSVCLSDIIYNFCRLRLVGQ